MKFVFSNCSQPTNSLLFVLKTEGMEGLMDCNTHGISALETEINGIHGIGTAHVAEAAAEKMGKLEKIKL